MAEQTLVITDLLQSKSADDNKKGDIVFQAIKNKIIEYPETNIALDFNGIELLNTAFLNNAIGQLFNRENFDLNKNKVRIINLSELMVDLVKETIAVARERY